MSIDVAQVYKAKGLHGNKHTRYRVSQQEFSSGLHSTPYLVWRGNSSNLNLDPLMRVHYH